MAKPRRMTQAEREAEKKAYRKEYYRKNRERLRKMQDEWRERNPGKVAEYRKRSEIKRKANGGKKQKEYSRKYYAEHREQMREYQRKWNEKNRERVREYQRKYQREHTAKRVSKRKRKINVDETANLFPDPVLKAHFMWVVNHNKNNKSK